MKQKNAALSGRSPKEPTTVKGLIGLCISEHIPLEELRIYIGQNVTVPDCTGIYKSKTTSNFIVYHNDKKGDRAALYKDTNEAEAVSLIYKQLYSYLKKKRKKTKKKSKKDSSMSEYIFFAGLMLFLCGLVFCGFKIRDRYFIPADYGYYRYENVDYYHYEYDNKWYRYDKKHGIWKMCEEISLILLPFSDGPSINYLITAYNEDTYSILESEHFGQKFKDSIFYSIRPAKAGYYRYDGHDYYNRYGEWYIYDEETDNWRKSDKDMYTTKEITSDNQIVYQLNPNKHTGRTFDEYWQDIQDQ